MSHLARFQTVALLAVLAAACADDKPRSLIPTAPVGVAPDAVSAYIAVSNTNPGVGSQVVVSVRSLRGSTVGPIGSFTFKLAYDPSRLRFVAASRSARGMVMTNPGTPGILVSAGAAAEGFVDDQLLSATFRVLAPDGLRSLSLDVTELNTVTFADQRSRMNVERGLYRASAETR